MKPTEPVFPAKLSRRRRFLVALGAIALALGLSLWLLHFLAAAQRDPLFRAKPESEWIKNLKYSDDNQVKEWQGYGEAGVQVLIRGLSNSTHPTERAYRRLYRSGLYRLARWVPDPKEDTTRSSRMCIVSLLSSLGPAAKSATPILLWTVQNDEAASVRQLALNYFNSGEDDHCLLNQLPAAQKQALLPALMRDVQAPDNWGLRNNAAISLRCYSAQRALVAPVLIRALQDAEPHVRLLAAKALNCVDPAAARTQRTSAVLAAIAAYPDDQIASQAVSALRDPGNQLETVVPALVLSLQSTNSIVGCEAVWALQWAPKEYQAYANTIIPALQLAAQRRDNVAKYARTALSRWTDPAESAAP